ncbi:MAG: 4-hydroxy-tetrahydrodipicolinate synthase [Deltaproteobacteria bacterium]|nr:4-hydroxy-tetrahydrodipicolinate synthase [Deltaproteobacteria bacterium]
MFGGAITALVTPMRDGAIDFDALRDFVEWQVAEGIDGVVPCGTTGEAATLSDDEMAKVIKTVVDQVNKRVPVIAGAGANNTARAIKYGRLAFEAGADALLHVTPYYNKPPQSGLIAHFTQIADASKLPIVLYNVPGRTACDMLPATVAELAKHPRIVGIKEATASIERAQAIIAAIDGVAAIHGTAGGDGDFAVMSGDDFTCLALTLVGGSGVISVVSNVAPKLTQQMIAAARAADLVTARKINYQLLPLIGALFTEANPIPVKAAVAHLGFGANSVRAPLLPHGGEHLERLIALINKIGIKR